MMEEYIDIRLKIKQFIVILSRICAAFVLIYILWLLCRVLLFDQFVIPTESMSPTLLPGDRVIVDKTIVGARIYSDFDFDPKGGELRSWRVRGMRQMKRNDIVVFNFPHHEGRINFIINNVYAKRCVALPGDTISIEEGYYRNNNHKGVLGLESAQNALHAMTDSMIWRQALYTMPFDGHLPWTIRNMGPLYIPRKGDIIPITAKEACVYRMLLEWETGKKVDFDWISNTAKIDGKEFTSHTFSHNYYFMAGDNVCDSNDSRYWGLVPEEYIVGVVRWVSYSLNKGDGELNKDRVFLSLMDN